MTYWLTLSVLAVNVRKRPGETNQDWAIFRGIVDIQLVIDQLDKEWEQPGGFLGDLRTGIFDPAGLQRLLQILEAVELTDEPVINRRFVALTWFIPQFMEWQRERIQKEGGNVKELDAGISKVWTLVGEILGLP